MSDEIYAPLFDGMSWSYSRITAFEDCPYKFYLKYICYPNVKEAPRFYASYGSFVHDILEKYFLGKIKHEDMQMAFLTGFEGAVKGYRPKQKTVNSYIADGSSFFSSFSGFPYKTIAVEDVFNFEVNDTRFNGRLDYIGENTDGDLVIVDHKSRNLKERSKRKKPTLNDMEIDKMLRQLYLYSYGVERATGKLPKKLCFNCFRCKIFIEEDFDGGAYKDTMNWAIKTIDDIKKTTDFYPNVDYFYCNNICGVEYDCLYAQSEFGKMAYRDGVF